MTYRFNGFRTDFGNTIKNLNTEQNGIYDAIIWISKDFRPHQTYVLDIKPYQTEPAEHCEGVGRHNEVIHSANSGILVINDSEPILSIQKNKHNDVPDVIIRGFEKMLEDRIKKQNIKPLLFNLFYEQIK